MHDTMLTVTGNLTADPEKRTTSSGVAIVRATVASTPRNYDRRSGEWSDGTTLFVRIVAFGFVAEHAAESLRKGDRVIVTGQLQARSWENDDGTRGTMVELVADDIGAALRYATVSISRTSRDRAQNEAIPA